MIDYKIFPELWLIKKNYETDTVFTRIEDCLIDSSIAQAFKITSAKAGRKRRRHGFTTAEH